ncbi:condensation domain-containing protein, partial [Streptomyces xiamenensis]|uniref:condensation domain-containing protein n=1 Tax=Streptomyces xiamenensis TaxID=408015 RepID=UPI0036F011D5
NTPTQHLLCDLISELLHTPHTTLDDNFFNLGGDSILSIQLVSRARKAGLAVTAREVYQARTVEELAAACTVHEPASPRKPDQGDTHVPLSPIMRWLEEQRGTVAGYNQAVLLRVPVGLGVEPLQLALAALLRTHDLLRSHLQRDASGKATQLIVPGADEVLPPTVLRVDVSELTEDGRRAAVAAEARHARARLSPEEGRMVQAVWFDHGPRTPGRLLLMLHHLVVDGVSWRIILPDLREAWTALSAGEEVLLEPAGTSFGGWARHLREEARAERRTGELDIWLDATRPAPLVPDGALDPARDTFGTSRSHTFELSERETESLLTTVPARFHAGVNDVLLTAVALAGVRWRSERFAVPGTHLTVAVEGHGREDLLPGADLSRTVGWFTSVYPVSLNPGEVSWPELLTDATATGAALKRVKEQLHDLPDHGIGYGLLRHLNPGTAAVLADRAEPQIGFNYLGRMPDGRNQEWTAAWDEEVPASGASADMAMSHLLEISAVTVEGTDGPRLVIELQWVPALLPEPGVRSFADLLAQVLGAFVEHVDRGEAGGYTPSDLPLVSLSQDEIDDLEAMFRDRA